MKFIRTIITYCLFPVVFVGTMCLAILGMDNGLHKVIILSLVSLTTGLIIIIFEQINPNYKQWNHTQNDIKTDIMHALVSMTLVPHILDIALAVTLLGVALNLSNIVGFAFWPYDWNIIMQLTLAMLISQFGEYWVHRFMHEKPFLWRFHATHHSPKRLYFLNAARFHPIDTGASHLSAYPPLVILGAGEEVLLLVAIWIYVHGMFQHCNIHLKLGWLNYIFSMAEIHRWHHSLVLEESNANYGNNIIFWDIVFGTMFFPKDNKAKQYVGIANLPNFPQKYISQILSPFKWDTITGSSKII